MVLAAVARSSSRVTQGTQARLSPQGLVPVVVWPTASSFPPRAAFARNLDTSVVKRSTWSLKVSLCRQTGQGLAVVKRSTSCLGKSASADKPIARHRTVRASFALGSRRRAHFTADKSTVQAGPSSNAPSCVNPRMPHAIATRMSHT